MLSIIFAKFVMYGLINEFKNLKGEDPSEEKYQFQSNYVNGLLAIIFVLGVLYSSLETRRMRSSQFGPGKWTAFTDLVPGKALAGVPRRLRIPLPRNSGLFNCGTSNPEYGNNSYIVQLCCNHPSSNDSNNDHNVASQMAQQKEFNLKNQSDSHYDVLLHGIFYYQDLVGVFLSNIKALLSKRPRSSLHVRGLDGKLS
ncbi:hypothetical protein DCAR_0206927 [Daucus carota subsp. sativus]|uniref:Uncharacterized protein n=1 Tax=Daucus carota subsp. sativus TaxID=79200 RepID=A0AAF0WE56_DAUCS|nr:hypothetical protein DCAR_0206927 [Daucus carota subsp. sativus]